MRVAPVIATLPRGTRLLGAVFCALAVGCSFSADATIGANGDVRDGAIANDAPLDRAATSEGSIGPAPDAGIEPDASTDGGSLVDDAGGAVDGAIESSMPEDAIARDAGGQPAWDAAGSPHVTLGIPIDSDSSDDYLIDDHYYVLSYNSKKEVPNWVSWRLVAADIGSAPRQNDFRTDALLPATFPAVGPNDYAQSGYDRGHMCPSADRTSTVEANSATFLMTNMQPQKHELNAGPWEELETYERTLATTQGKEVFIMAGGIFDAQPTKIGPGIAVPRANYKIVVALAPGQGVSGVTVDTTLYAVIMPNETTVSGMHWQQYAVSVDDIEQATGYDFLNRVPDAITQVLEAKKTTPPP